MTTKMLTSLASQGFMLSYGTLSLGAFLLLAFSKKNSFRKLGTQGKKELAIAREKLWNLDNHPNGLNHRFCVLRTGFKLHYVEAAPSQSSKTTNLVIFIHGFPDSWALWQHYLRHPRLQKNATLVAVDLPGFGGSDGLNAYGPSEVMDAMTEFVLKMREQYLTGEHGRVVIAAHDWGAMVGFRLGSETEGLADRYILSNCIHPALAVANVRTRLDSAWQMVRTWLHSPFNLRLLRTAAGNLTPLLRQVVKSGYVFVFNLPYPLSNIVGSIGDFWFLRYLNAVSTHPNPAKPLEGSYGAEMLASSVGPSMIECTSAVNASELAYSESVRQRARTGGWLEKIRVYREGLAFKPWEKSLETLWELNQLLQNGVRRRSSSNAGLFDTGPAGSIRAPVTVIWGKSDVAIENTIAIEGFRDYFGAKSSQLIMISHCGHWAPVEKQGIPIFEEVIEWATTGEKGLLKDKLGDNFPLATLIVER